MLTFAGTQRSGAFLLQKHCGLYEYRLHGRRRYCLDSSGLDDCCMSVKRMLSRRGADLRLKTELQESEQLYFKNCEMLYLQALRRRLFAMLHAMSSNIY